MTRVFHLATLAPNSLFLAIRVSCYLQMLGVHLSRGRLIFCFQRDKEEDQSVLLSLTFS